MAKQCDVVEQMIKDSGCSGRRVTKELIESRIVETYYQTTVVAGQKMMFCGIKMDNGFVVVGKPATCIDPENWRDEIGQKISYDNSFEEIWKLEAYRMLSEGVGSRSQLLPPNPMKTLHNSTVSGAHQNVADLKVYGNGDTFKLICKASSDGEGWMKSTKAMQIDEIGCVVQVTTQQGNNVSEALTFVPGVRIAEINGDKTKGRKLVASYK